MSAVPAITVVVATRNRPALLDGGLAALRTALRPGDELVVVDSASTDPAVLEVALAHGARVLRCGWPGTSRARNRGAREAAHELVAFVDDDVRVVPGWAGAVAAAAAAHPQAAFLTGRITVPDHQSGAQRPVALLDRADPVVIDAATPPPVPGHGANLAVRRAAFLGVGGFDERLGPGAPFPAAEDLDLFDRLVGAGLTGRYEPSMAASHEQWRGRWTLLRLEWAYGVGAGARLDRLRRTDPGRARAVAVEDLWRNGLRTVPGSVRDRYEFGVAFVVVRALATVWGSARAWSINRWPGRPTGMPPPAPEPQPGARARP